MTAASLQTATHNLGLEVTCRALVRGLDPQEARSYLTVRPESPH
jgi:hypothetical protein